MHLDDPQVRTSEVAVSRDDDVARPGPPQTAPRRCWRGAADLVGGATPGGATLVRLAVVLVLIAGIVLRFVVRSDLWLDEALTVDIAREPLRQIPALLRHDGAPPLYYVLLHFWMKVFGQSNLGARSLSGVIGLLNLPLMWIAGYRVGSRWWSLNESEGPERRRREERGRVVAWAGTLLLAVSPFAVYYDTEARMYGLALLLGTLGIIAYSSILRRPDLLRSLALAVVVSALLYSHYWALYAGAVLAAGTAWRAVRGPNRRAYGYALGALAIGAVSFAPWVPTFLYQLHHTGTPWAKPAGFTTIVYTMTQFAGGNSVPGRALALLFIVLALLALAGAALDGRHVVLDLRTRPGARALLFTSLGTLVLGVGAARLSHSTFDVRYTAPIVAPALLVVAYGLTSLSDPRVRNGVLGITVLLSLVAAAPNVDASRTEAGTVANVINTQSHPGDVVAYCPDQLGPAVSREITARGLRQITFPRGNQPQIVDWVDYLSTVRAASPARFAAEVERLAGTSHTIWYVWAPSYAGFGSDCELIGQLVGRLRTQVQVVADVGGGAPFEIYEGDALDRFSPR